MQAACGLAQLKRLPEFIEQRNANYQHLKSRLTSLNDFLDVAQATDNSSPSWFGFPITLKETAGTTRNDLINYLDQNKIGTRLLFAGESHPPALFSAHRLSRCRRFNKYRHHHESDVLVRHLSGADTSTLRLCGRQIRNLLWCKLLICRI